MSTAIERVMRERGDFECLHEPFLHYYYLERSDRPFPHFETEQEHPSRFADVRDLILQKAEQNPVFAKDMSYYVLPELFEYGKFCRRIQHCFLIRHPLRSILSYYKLDPGMSRYEIGLEAQWQHFCRLRDIGIEPGPVIEAEKIQADSAGMMRRFWHELGLDFREQALGWEAGKIPEDWDYVKGWHGSVGDSAGIRPVESDLQEAEQAFGEACEQAPRLREYLEHHLPFYRHLQQYAVGPMPYAAAY